MAMRVLSGLILPDAEHLHRGKARIRVDNNTISGDISGYGGQWAEDMGPKEPFKSEPCKIVALRQISFNDQDHSRPSEAFNVDAKAFNINTKLKNANPDLPYDRSKSVHYLDIRWSTDGTQARIHEISYMIIGDV